MADRAAKQALFDEFARVGKALASGRRIELLDVLANGERTVEGLARESGLSVANTSQHLQVLRQAGLVATRRDGTSVHYRLATSEVFELWRALRTLASSRLAEVERLAAASLTARSWWCWMSAQPRSTPPGTCPARCRSRWRSCGGGWPSCHVTARSS